MSLRDIVSNADLAVFPEIGMILFLIAFLAVVARVLVGSTTWDHAAQLPLEEGVRVGALPEEETA